VPHDSDAPEYLQEVILNACQVKPVDFIKYMRVERNQDARAIISLLADHEAIAWDKDYQNCIDILKSSKADDLAAVFEKERTLRIKKPND